MNRSLSSKLTVSILLLSIPVFMLTLGSLFIQSRFLVRQKATERVSSSLNTSLQRVSTYLKTLETATNANAWMVLENLEPDALLACTHRIVQMNANVNGCSITAEPFLFPEYGRYFSAYTIREGDSIHTVREGEYEYFEKPWYKNPVTQGKACWVDPFDDYNEGTLSAQGLIASYCKPLYLEKAGANSQQVRQLVGVISTDLSLQQLTEVVNTERPYPHSFFMMTGHQGRYYIHPDKEKIARNTIFDDASKDRQAELYELGHRMSQGQQGSMHVKIDGIACTVSYHPVPGTQWSLALVCPDDDILQSYHKLATIVMPLLIVGLLIILLMCYRTVGSAVSPLRQLARQSRHIAEGDFSPLECGDAISQQIEHSKRQDAIGQLQNSFLVMQQSLNSHISDIRLANEQTKESNEQLARATQMARDAAARKTSFIQNMTHQIRTPLNIIMGFAQIMRDNLGQLTEVEAKSIAETTSHNVTTLNRMVLMLFDCSDTGLTKGLSDSKNQTMVNCIGIAQECMEYTKKQFTNLHINFQADVPDTLTMHTNHIYFLRSLRELLYNAAKYSDGENVTLRLSETDESVRFTVEDTGSGIPEEYRDIIFDPFSKADDLSEGLGLGLPLTKRHIDNLGGTLTLDTDYHEGCRFVIEMPKMLKTQ